MTSPTPSDNRFQSDQPPDHTNLDSNLSNTNDAYSELVNTFNQLGVNAAYHDISKLDFNIFEIPDLRSIDDLANRERRGTTPSSRRTNFLRTNP